jgi:hypothetical protein
MPISRLCGGLFDLAQIQGIGPKSTQRFLDESDAETKM